MLRKHRDEHVRPQERRDDGHQRREGLEQLAHVISGLGRSCRAQGLSSCVVQRVLVEREDLRRRLRDRLGIPSAVGTARFLWHRFADSVARTLGLDPHRDPALIDALR